MGWPPSPVRPPSLLQLLAMSMRMPLWTVGPSNDGPHVCTPQPGGDTNACQCRAAGSGGALDARAGENGCWPPARRIRDSAAAAAAAAAPMIFLAQLMPPPR